MSARSFDIKKTCKQGNIQVLNTENGIEVCLHGHKVFRFNERLNQIVLSSCGWKTVTTKTTINRAFKELGLNFGVFCEKGIWYLSADNGEKIQFADNMKIDLAE